MEKIKYKWNEGKEEPKISKRYTCSTFMTWSLSDSAFVEIAFNGMSTHRHIPRVCVVEKYDASLSTKSIYQILIRRMRIVEFSICGNYTARVYWISFHMWPIKSGYRLIWDFRRQNEGWAITFECLHCKFGHFDGSKLWKSFSPWNFNFIAALGDRLS